MKRNVKRLLAFLLVVTLVGTSGGFGALRAYAEGAKEVKKPEVSSKTSDSVILKTEAGYEYAIKTESDDGTTTWEWAKSDQYNKDKSTVTFKSLKAETKYEFAGRIKGETDESSWNKNSVTTDKVVDETETKAPETETKAPETETQAPETETQAPETETKAPETETQAPETETKAPETETKAPETETQAPETETEALESENKVPNKSPLLDSPTPKAGAPGVPEQDSKTDTSVLLKVVTGQEYAIPTSDPDPDTWIWNNTGSFTNLNANTQYNFVTRIKADGANPASDVSKPLSVTTKASATAAPAVPELDSKTDTSVSLKVVAGQEYGMLVNGAAGTWNETGIFTGLNAGTDYSFVTRVKYDENTQIPSVNSEALTVKTKTAAAAAPLAPEMDSRTDVKIQLKAVTGQEYAMLTNGTAGIWNETGTFEGLTAGTQYSFVTRVKYDDSAVLPSNNSPALNMSTMLAAAAAPTAPELSGHTETSITLKTIENAEYAIKSADSTWRWQSSPEFTGLKAGSQYSFIARIKYDAANAMESKASAESAVKTIISFDGSKIDGIIADKAYDLDTKLTATAIGAGMDNSEPTISDSRYIPRTWDWDGKNYRSWTQSPYSVTFMMDKAGDYKMTVVYELEEYTSNGWSATGQKKSISVAFKAVTPVYTINASAGKNGAISPSGDVSVKKGENAQYTLTPNKGYRVAKVLIDGKEVKVKDNKYTFTGVTGNHKISVTFERDSNLTAPKTGDNAPILLLFGVVIVSAAIIIVLFILYKRRDKKINHK